MKININDEIIVRLTYAGLIAWNQYWIASHPEGVPETIRKSATLPDGRIRFQLWSAMAIFGDNCYNGSQKLPFVGNEVEILEDI